ncbi:hypothetical protein Dsin_016036 [Dipteronia sinensis]|uniref:Tudor domain-containing protein n=1 Tax=Dipteronia sinensis TaxID=43782 RepID=A0AAE0ADQ3_9ROSI|nr:hypothetical protein Dsin_016036 [Dipteronia sinensis]
MASADNELEQQLSEAGVKLAEPPSSVDELLSLLDQIESCLSRVEQSPSKSMQTALYPSLKALVTDQVFRHSDVDVNVAVAACISEITRITAPDAPYEDDQMKEVFQLIVSSFENLSDKSSRSFAKRTSILETVAKVRSCVVMLDLECDALLVEMFQHFLKAIRDDHPENVFACMETIMTLVVEESEDISQELLSPILACVKKDNEEVLPIARKLGEKVLESSAAKLKPYLLQAVKSSGISLDDYSKVVASICQEVPGAVEQNDVHVSNEQTADEHESKSAGPSADETTQVDQQDATEAASTEQVDTANDKSPKSVVSNGITQTEENDSLADTDTLKKQESDNLTDLSKSADTPSNAERDGLDTEKVVNTEQKSEQTTKKRGKKTTSSMKSGEPSDGCHIEGEKEDETPLDHKTSSKDVPSSPREDASVEGAVSSENGKETGTQITSPKVTEGESTDVSPPPAGSLPSEGRAQMLGRQKKKESLVKEAAPSAVDVTRRVSEGTSDSEAKPHKKSGKKALAGTTASEDKTHSANALKKESGSTSDSETKLLKRSAKKVDTSNNGDESSLKLPDEKKRREKASSGKDNAKSSAKDEKETGPSPKTAGKSNKDEHQVEETQKTNTKRNRTPGNEKASNTEDFGDILVGSKVKVWWPKDQQFYDGVIDSFDPTKKRHKVLYNDGDEEILNLKRERWEFIGEDSESDEEQTTDVGSPDASEIRPSKKKRSKMSSDLTTKQGKMDTSPKRDGGASSSKSKASAQKSGRKSKDESKADGKSKDGSKSVTKSENERVGKTKDHASKSGGKSADVASKSASKSKNDAVDTSKSSKSKESSSAATSKTSSKSKQDTPKASKSKQETPKTSTSNAKGKTTPKTVGGKSSANGSGKSKSSSSKVKESEDVKDATETKVPESTPSKAQGSEAKSGKKRRRG